MGKENGNNIDISIIIPTYNEKDNISILIERLHKSMIGIDYEIVIVDDNSTDGTIACIRELTNKYPMRLIVRTEIRGLASAIVEGFNHAKGDIFVVMDADLQHPPEKVPELVEEIRKGNDIVVGSRYLEENGFENFNLYRKSMSKIANIPAKILFSELKNVRDIQSGFFALNKNVISDIILNPMGYKILIEILIMGNYKKVQEIPFGFNKREYGHTKLGNKIVIQYLLHLATLYWRKKKLGRFARFCTVGITGIFVNMAILYFFTTMLGIYYMISAIMAYEASIMSNFILNDIWTFKDSIIPGRSHSFLVRALHFNWTRASGAILSIFILYVMTEFISINYISSNMISIMIGTLWSYYSSVMIVWKN